MKQFEITAYEKIYNIINPLTNLFGYENKKAIIYEYHLNYRFLFINYFY